MHAPTSVAKLQRQIRQNADELNQYVQDVHDWQRQSENRRPSDTKSRSAPSISDTPKVDVAEIRERGNAQFRAGQYGAATRTYTECLEHDPGDTKALANRAAAHLKLGRNVDAERDCTAALAHDANNVKVLLRRGTARTALQKTQSAILDFEAIVRIAGAGTSPADIAQKHIDRLRTFEKKPRVMSSAQLPLTVKDLPRRRMVIEEVSEDDDDDIRR